MNQGHAHSLSFLIHKKNTFLFWNTPWASGDYKKIYKLTPEVSQIMKLAKLTSEIKVYYVKQTFYYNTSLPGPLLKRS